MIGFARDCRRAALLTWACAVALCACADGDSRADPDAAIELDASESFHPDGSDVADDAGPDAQAPASDAMTDAAEMDAQTSDAASTDAADPDGAADASTDDRDAYVDNGGAAPRAFADCTDPWGWESEPPAAQPPRAPATLGTVAPLAFELFDAEYVPAVERFVGVSASPPALRVFAPSGAVELNVMLSSAPTALSVAPDGSRAAVGHADSVALVDLETGDDTVLPFTPGVADLVDAGGDFIYVTSTNSLGGFARAIFNIEIATGVITHVSVSGGLSAGRPIELHPSGDRIYAAGRLEPRGHFDISNGPAVLVSVAGGTEYFTCELHLSADGDHALDGCGTVFHLDEDPNLDLMYETGLPLDNELIAAAHSAELRQYAAIFDRLPDPVIGPPDPYATLIRSQVRTFDDDYLTEHAAATLPPYVEAAQSAPLWGRWIAYSAGGDELYVIAQTPPDSSLPGRSAVVTLPAALAPRAPSASLDPDGAVLPLGTSVTDAEYSRALERIVMVSDVPAEIGVLDPETLEHQRLPLVREPLDLALDPSGHHAVVAHDGWVAHYALDPLRLLQLVPVGARVPTVAVDDEQFAYSYASARRGMLIVDLPAGETGWSVTSGVSSTGYYVAEQRALFSTDHHRISRLPAHAGTVGAVTESLGDDSTCWEAWFAEDGRAFGACGHVFQADEDMLYRGTLPGFEGANYAGYNFIDHLDIADGALVALIPREDSSLQPPSERVEREVRLHDDPYFAPRAVVHVPSFALDGQPVTGFPRFVFFSANGRDLYVLVDAAASAALDHDTGIVEVDLSSLALCPDPGPEPLAVEGSRLGSASLTVLDFDVVDAERSRALDRIVIVSASPAALWLLDPATGDVSGMVDLPLAATSVGLASDGLSAVVGHDGWLSTVALETLEVEHTWPVSAEVWDVAVGAAHAYVFPARDQTTPLRTLELATGIETRTESIRAGYRGRLTPDGLALLHVPSTLTTDEQLRRIGLTAGLPTAAPGVVVADEVGRDFWYSEDGARLFGAKGRVFDLQAPHAASFAQLATLETPYEARSRAHSAASGRVATVRRGNVQSQEAYVLLHDDVSYASVGQRTLPSFMAGGNPVPTSGRFVFFSEDGAELYVLVEAVSDERLARRFGLVRMPTIE